MMCEDIIVVDCENQVEHADVLYGENMEFLG
jgi:hypothetical protein